MMPVLPEIHPRIEEAHTLPGWFYCDEAIHRALVERVFARSWQLVADADAVRVPGSVWPFTFLDGCVDEPLLLTRDIDDRLHCLSNVCTHRGNLVCEGSGVERTLRCRYHGRRFELSGRMTHMPEFENVAGFPSPTDDLAAQAVEPWGPVLIAALRPFCAFAEWLAPVVARIGHLPLAAARLDPARSRDYLVRANWALYCDNYLEGFHIPYVHASLNDQLDYGSYRTELFRFGSLQVGIGQGGDDLLDLPAGAPDAGARVSAYYFWLFPNTMVNVYPWGISFNVVRPLAIDRTRVSFLAYVWDAARLDRGAGSGLDRVEREDEAVVEAVQRGMRSRLYTRGRYSPTRETGVHHFHRLMCEFLAGAR